MILPKFNPRILWLAGWLAATGAMGAANADTRAVAGTAATEAAKTNTAPRLAPGANDGRIAYWVATLLGRSQYSAHPFDDGISEKFFYRYLDSLDPQHLHFLQSDLAEFDHYRTNLDNLTITTNRVGDITPAFEIFSRFVERLEQRVACSDELLKNGKFKFDTDERMLVNRHDAPYPRDLDEARAIWRQRLRFEYLQEELGRTGLKKKPEASPSSKDSPPAAGGGAPAGPAAPSVEARKKTDAEEITDLLTRRYNRTLRTYKEWDSEDVVQVYLTALAHVYDPHSDYFNKLEAENFAIGMNLSLFGIGAELYSDDGYCTIRALVPSGPAIKSKQIKEMDRIVAVAQGDAPPVDVVDMSLNKVVQMIRGPKGTEVRLTLMPAADPSSRRVVSLIRDEIKLEDKEAKTQVIDWPTASGKRLRLAVIDLPAFYATLDLPGVAHRSERTSLSADVARYLVKLKHENVDGVILDLRRDGGGSLEEAIRLTGLFIKEGPVVLIRRADGGYSMGEDRDSEALYDGPLVVLTSRFSASASEIFAGALQDYGRALIVGDVSTHGKGTVQNLNYLTNLVSTAELGTNYSGELKITISKFYRISGASTQLKGVMPDIVLPSIWNYATNIGERALENPLPWDEIRGAQYQKLNLVEPCLEELLRRSTERLATNQDFAYIYEDIDQFRKNQAEKTISLNEAQRLKEKEDNAARQQAREKEIKARFAQHPPAQIVYDLPLRLVDSPGLPPHVSRTNTVAAKSPGADGGLPAAGTNSASVMAKGVVPPARLNDTPEEAPLPAVDPTLDETERILADYISLLKRKGMLTASH